MDNKKLSALILLDLSNSVLSDPLPMDHSPIRQTFELGKFTSHDCIFHILRYFSTKLHNFTKFMMLFPAVLMNFPNSEVCLIGQWSITHGMQQGAISYRPYCSVFILMIYLTHPNNVSWNHTLMIQKTLLSFALAEVDTAVSNLICAECQNGVVTIAF